MNHEQMFQTDHKGENGGIGDVLPKIRLRFL